MKIKSFAMLAMSGLLAVSCVYIAPAMADDTTPSAGQSMPAPSDSNSQNSSMNMQNNSTQNDTNNTNNTNNSSSSSSDEGSPDTATGDDDY